MFKSGVDKMFIKDYLDDTHDALLLENYSEKFLNTVDEHNFKQIYTLFQFLGFDYIDDIIVRYLEIFTLKYEEVLKGIMVLKERIGFDYIDKISENLSILKDILEMENS